MVEEIRNKVCLSDNDLFTWLFIYLLTDEKRITFMFYYGMIDL